MNSGLQLANGFKLIEVVENQWEFLCRAPISYLLHLPCLSVHVFLNKLAAMSGFFKHPKWGTFNREESDGYFEGEISAYLFLR